MAGSVFDSAMFARLFPTGEVGRLFTDSAEIRAMLLVEGALARVQGARGIIPADSAEAIARAAMEVQIDGGQLARATGENGVSVPGLVAAFRRAMEAPEHAQYAHWGTTSQDVIDTALMLRLRQALALIEEDVKAALAGLSALAATHAELPMAARTFGQHANVTSFGAVAAGWGWPLIGLLDDLDELRGACLFVSLSGATGTSSQLGPDPEGLRAELAKALGLADPGRDWHTDRTPVLKIADWMTRLTAAYGKLGEDATDLAQTEIGELRLGGAGASSTLPQKRNPIAPSALAALARQGAGLLGILNAAAAQRHQRDGGPWFTEWMCLPQIVLGAAAAARTACDLCAGIAPVAPAMQAALTASGGLIHAEALSFALSAHLPRPDAQAATKALCRKAAETATPLVDLVARNYPEIDAISLFDPARQMGSAPAAARRFAKAAGRFRPA